MLKWTDINDIAIELTDNHPDVDPQYVNFVDLRKWVLALENFSDDPDRRESSRSNSNGLARRARLTPR
jgi:FeS assembly protein IscX